MDKIKRTTHRNQFYQKNRERLLAIQREYNKKHSKEIRAYQRVYYRYKCYGIGKDDFEQMVRSQNNKCDICESTFDMNDKKLSPHVDHNHSTGKLRRLLCMKCNCGIGSFNDNPALLKKAIDYLQSFS